MKNTSDLQLCMHFNYKTYKAKAPLKSVRLILYCVVYLYHKQCKKKINSTLIG